MMNRLAILLSIVGCLVFGAILFIELEPAGTGDATVTEVAARPEIAPALHRQPNPRIDELLAAILARPLFNSTRRPPQSAPSEAATDSDLAGTRLTGIVTEPSRRIAIFAVNGEKPLRVAEGEAVSGWRIESITPREVSLSGPSGTKILQPKTDPGLAPPPGQLPAGNAGGRLPIPPAAGAAPRLPIPPVAGIGQPNPGGPVNAPGAPARPARLRQQR
jgi:general secretion pathway protein N